MILSSKHIVTRVVSKEDKSVSEGADWLNRISFNKLKANKKPGGEKRKRDGLMESDIISTKKQRGGSFSFVTDQ